MSCYCPHTLDKHSAFTVASQLSCWPGQSVTQLFSDLRKKRLLPLPLCLSAYKRVIADQQFKTVCPNRWTGGYLLWFIFKGFSVHCRTAIILLRSRGGYVPCRPWKYIWISLNCSFSRMFIQHTHLMTFKKTRNWVQKLELILDFV